MLGLYVHNTGPTLPFVPLRT